MVSQRLSGSKSLRNPRRASDERGIALLMVLTLIVMVTAFVADFTYTSRIKYTMAAHARDAEKAQALAVSGVRMYQMLLMYGDQMQRRFANNPLAQAFLGGMGSGSMVTQLIPILDTSMLRALGSGSELPPEGEAGSVDAPPAPAGSFLDFDGDFTVTVKSEGSKISLLGMGRMPAGPGSQLLLQLLKREEYQYIFRDLDMTPEDLVANIVDWVDVDSERANGQGYEDNIYSRLADPYNSKNAGYDSLAELHLVAGMTDELYDIVAPMVTPYTELDKVNMPIKDGKMLGALVRAALPDIWFTDSDLDVLWEQYQLNMVSEPTNAQQLAEYLRTLGSGKLSGLNEENLGQFVQGGTNQDKIFRLTSTGRVGDVERTVEMVLDIRNDRKNGGQILYWREE